MTRFYTTRITLLEKHTKYNSKNTQNKSTDADGKSWAW